MVFRRNGSSVWIAKVPDESGRWHTRYTGTRDKVTAKKVQRMLDELGPEGARDWELLHAVTTKRITIAQLYDRWSKDELVQLRAELNDVDLASYIPAWLKSVQSRGVKPDTIQHYELHVRSLVGTRRIDRTVIPYLRSTLTIGALTTWLSELDVTTGTRRKYHAAMSSFLGYLSSMEVMPTNLMRNVKAPKAGKPRDRHLTTVDAMKLADAQPEPFRTFSALLAGTGIDVSTALQLTRADIDITHREIRARGTKTHNRDRIAKVATWAWPYIEQHIRSLLPSGHLFAFTRWEAGDIHRTACDAIGISEYWMRDARHTWAVRWARSGGSAQQGALQLGHKDATLFLKVYGVYYPTSTEREHWEQAAAQQDAEALKTAPRTTTSRRIAS